ncbi:MAG: hypothetical protein U0V70_11340 [Terriglobia bacterium]
MSKKIVRMLFAVTLVSVLAGVSGYAQTANAVKASIPFEFRIGNESLPAGDYVISNVNGARVMIKNVNGSKSVSPMTNDVQANRAASDGKLVFNRYGDLYFLSQIWTPGEEVGRTLLKSNAEKEVASRNVPSETNIQIAGKTKK